jgi:hypothetical protein
MSYSIEEHKHRFASWAASRGASTSPNCRFEVELGKLLLEESGLKKIAQDLNNLPEPAEFDNQHKVWRNTIIELAKQHQKMFTHGVAAKLINLYLKSIFICGENIDNPKIKAIHPPIDSLLLDELYKQNIGGKRRVWQAAREAKWSKFTCDEYEQVITEIQSITKTGHGLWEVEQYWQGYQ